MGQKVNVTEASGTCATQSSVGENSLVDLIETLLLTENTTIVNSCTTSMTLATFQDGYLQEI